MIHWLKNKLKSSPIFAFNQVERDRWVYEQAALIPAGSRVLDVGAGSCPYRSVFAHCEYRTQDFKELKGEQLRSGAYGGIDYICDASAMPIETGTFDVILCTEVIEHVPQPIDVVHEFARILKPGGILLLTAPLGSGIHQEPYHYYGGYTPYWYEKFLKEAGFSEIYILANSGSFKFFGQEAMRFMRLSWPGRLPASFIVRLIWFPFWLVLLPILGVFIPVITYLLDRYDTEQKFTIGYHVRAVRGQ